MMFGKMNIIRIGNDKENHMVIKKNEVVVNVHIEGAGKSKLGLCILCKIAKLFKIDLTVTLLLDSNKGEKNAID